MKKTYEVVIATDVVDLSNQPVKKLNVGDEIVGEVVLIDDNPYVETNEGYVNANSLAEKLEVSDSAVAEATVKSSNKKLIYALVGGAVGFGVAHYMKKDVKTKIFFSVGGVALGLFLDYLNSRKK